MLLIEEIKARESYYIYPILLRFCLSRFFLMEKENRLSFILFVEVLLDIDVLAAQLLDTDNSVLFNKFSLSSVLNTLSGIHLDCILLNESTQCLFLCPSSIMKENSPILKQISVVFLSSTCTYICSLSMTEKSRLYFLLTRRVGRVIAKQVSKRKQ